MTTTEWPVEYRELPAHLRQAAAANPGGSVAEIDGSQIPDPDGYVPVEAIIGIYAVGPDGRPTGVYHRNPAAGPIRDDFTRLESADHFLDWLPDTPSASVRRSVEEQITSQVSGTAIEWIKVTEDPAFLTGGRRDPSDESRLILTRAALAVQLAFSVMPPSGPREVLLGSLSWVASGLDGDSARQQVWLDLGMGIAQATELLRDRIYALD